MNDEEIYRKAQKKVQAKKGFFVHLLIYALMIGMLYLIISSENNGEILPVLIVGLSWGVGLGIHYLKSFGTEHLDFLGFESNWEEEELRREVEKMERTRELKERIGKEKRLLADADTDADGEPLELKEIVKKPLQKDRD